MTFQEMRPSIEALPGPEARRALAELLGELELMGIRDIEELRDAESDAERMRDEWQKYASHFGTKARPILRNGDTLCPKCEGSVHPLAYYCSRCGKRLGWR